MPRERRLSRPDFKRLAGLPSRRSRSELFAIKAYPSLGPEAKFAVVVSKRVAPRAVVRNLIRRRFYSIARECPFEPGSYVITVLKSVQNSPLDELKRAFEGAVTHIDSQRAL